MARFGRWWGCGRPEREAKEEGPLTILQRARVVRKLAELIGFRPTAMRALIEYRRIAACQQCVPMNLGTGPH